MAALDELLLNFFQAQITQHCSDLFPLTAACKSFNHKNSNWHDQEYTGARTAPFGQLRGSFSLLLLLNAVQHQCLSDTLRVRSLQKGFHISWPWLG